MTVKTNELSAESFLQLYSSVGFYQKHGFKKDDYFTFLWKP